MKRTNLNKLVFLLALVVANSFEVFAYNFEVNSIYYSINSGDSTVNVTFESFSSGVYYSSYNGDANIPTTVTYQNKTYKVTAIEIYAFYNCSGLTSVTIPNSVTSIGQRAFCDCTGLTSVTISNSVTSIGESAFKNCRKLKELTIPYPVTNIGSDAFNYCEDLTDVTCLAITPPLMGNYTCIYPAYYMATLHVPERSLEAYKATEWWNCFINIVGDASEDGTIPNTPATDKCDTNDDGEVNIADVNRVIDAILGHQAFSIAKYGMPAESMERGFTGISYSS